MGSEVLVSSWTAGKVYKAFIVFQGWDSPKIIIDVNCFVVCLVGDWEGAEWICFIYILKEKQVGARLWSVWCIQGVVNTTKLTIGNLTCHSVCAKWEGNILSI